MIDPIPRSLELESFCKLNGIRSLALFGSFLHGTARSDSDIDLLVEFDPSRSVGLFAVSRMELELSDMLGRKVDLRTAEDLSRYFRDTVRSEAKTVYAES
jgi:uncharacterized protein